MLLPILYSKLDLGQRIVRLLVGNKALKRFGRRPTWFGMLGGPLFAAAGKRARRKALPIAGAFKDRHSGVLACAPVSLHSTRSQEHRSAARAASGRGFGLTYGQANAQFQNAAKIRMVRYLRVSWRSEITRACKARRAGMSRSRVGKALIGRVSRDPVEDCRRCRE